MKIVMESNVFEEKEKDTDPLLKGCMDVIDQFINLGEQFKRIILKSPEFHRHILISVLFEMPNNTDLHQ